MLLIFLLAILIPASDLSSPAFHMMYSTYKLNKPCDNIQPWHTPFPIWNQSVVPCQLLPDPQTDFSRGRSGGLVFSSLEEFSSVCCDPHSQRLWHSQYQPFLQGALIPLRGEMTTKSACTRKGGTAHCLSQQTLVRERGDEGLLPSSSLAELTLQTRSFLFTVSPHQMGQVSVFSHQGLLGNCNNPLYFSDSNEVASILS